MPLAGVLVLHNQIHTDDGQADLYLKQSPIYLHFDSSSTEYPN